MYLSRRYRVSFYSENKFLFYYHRTLPRSPVGLLRRKVRSPPVVYIIEGLSPTKSCAIFVLYLRVPQFVTYFQNFYRKFYLLTVSLKAFCAFLALFQIILLYVRAQIGTWRHFETSEICYFFLSYVITERRFIRIRIFNFRCVTLRLLFSEEIVRVLP